MEELKQENIKSIEAFRTITKGKIELLLDEISESTGVDFTSIPVEIVGSGDLLFDFQEVQTKLYKKIGGWNQYNQFLKENGFSIPPPFTRESVDQLRSLATKQGIELDGSFEGFVYNLGGMKIMYTDIPKDKVIEMAKKYSQKEGEVIECDTLEQAECYLQILAEKYFFHEIGHSVYLHLLPSQIQKRWNVFVDSDTFLKKKVIDVQKDKHPTIDSIPVANEAFADIFADIVTHDSISNRLGRQEKAVVLMKNILESIGFNFLHNKAHKVMMEDGVENDTI